MRAIILITENPDPSPGQAHEEKKTHAERGKDGRRLQLFREGLRCMGYEREASRLDPDQIDVAEYGKPFFKDIPQVRISLSHSGKYLVCAFSEEEIGLDLQECITPRTEVLRIAKRFFTSEEYDALLSIYGKDEKEGNEFFFCLWSLKEAYLKYIGCGLHGGLDSFQPDPLPLNSEHSASKGTIRVSDDFGLKPSEFSAARGTIRVSDDFGLKPSEHSASRGTIRVSDDFGLKPSELSAARGTIRVLREKNLMTPAEYSFLPAPQGYKMAVSAGRLPDHIQIRHVDFSDDSFQQ